MDGFDEHTREVLIHIEWQSKGGWTAAEVPPEWENAANRSIILGLSVMDGSGARRLTPHGRRKIHNLSVSSRKLLSSLLRGPKRTVVKSVRWDGKIFDLARSGLVDLRKISGDAYTCKYICRVTTLGHSYEKPPPILWPTHIVRMTYVGDGSPKRISVKFSGNDAEAEARMMLLWNTYLREDYPRRSAVAIRLSDQEKIARISQGKGYADPTHWKMFEMRH